MFTTESMKAYLLFFASALILFAQSPGSVRITAADPQGGAVDAQGELLGDGDTRRFPFVTGPSGTVTIENVPPGDYQLTISGSGFETLRTTVQVFPDEVANQNITLELARVGVSIVVRVLPGNLDGVPGSTAELTRADLDLFRSLSVKESLRRVTGVHIVDEDAFGLNLNVGIRGLNPRRTQRTLIMEDGAPIHLAPYSDPSAHYHTPPELIESIEVVKGSGQILHGPQTVGGMMNFVTEPVPTKTRGSFGAQFGNRDFRGAQGKLGTGGDRGGLLGHFIHRDGAGTRDNHSHRVLHTGLKGGLNFATNQTLQLKFGYYEEDSRYSEAGVSQAAFENNPLANPFRSDRFNLNRYSAQALHGVSFSDGLRLTSNFYYQNIDRASYRQADFAGDEMTANPATGCTGAARRDYQNAHLCGNKMRPRSYEFVGFEPRLDMRGRFLRMRNETSAGVRYHREDIVRRRFNGLTPDARESSPGVLFRDWNTIRTSAFPAYLQSRFFAGNWSFTPGLRLEHVRSRNLVLRRGNVPQNSELEATQTFVLPGFGVTYLGLPRSSVFGGIHRGFAPPRPDDNFDPLDPRVVPVTAERSTNYELGIRTYATAALQLEATLFRIDFTNQIVAGETVGRPEITWANAGKSLNAGAEFGARYDLNQFLPAGHNLFVTTSYTRVFTAAFNSTQIISGIDVRGNRLPYAPGHTVTPSMTYQYRSGFNMSLSAEHVSPQFADALNLRTPSADGQNGILPSFTVFNGSMNVPLRERGPVLFLSAANIGDRRYIATRIDGIQVGRPRQVFGGIRWEF